MLSAKVREKSIGKMKPMRLLAVLLIPVVALILGATSSVSWGFGGHEEFEESDFNIEFNATDEDLGVRAFVDGEPWKSVTIINPNWRTILAVKSIRSLGKQGLAELFFESGEPTLEEVPIEEFLARFPEGTYRFFGWTVDGKFVKGMADFTHVIPCGPDPDLDAEVDVPGGTVTITWSEPDTVVNPLTTVSGNVQCIGPAPTIVGYEVILEGDDTELTFKLPVGVNELIIPLSLLEADTEYQFEVIAIEESGNQTITEDDFMTPK